MIVELKRGQTTDIKRKRETETEVERVTEIETETETVHATAHATVIWKGIGAEIVATSVMEIMVIETLLLSPNLVPRPLYPHQQLQLLLLKLYNQLQRPLGLWHLARSLLVNVGLAPLLLRHSLRSSDQNIVCL
jgi:hypothetical protein